MTNIQPFLQDKTSAYTYLILLHIFTFKFSYYFDMKQKYKPFCEVSNSPWRAAIKPGLHIVRLENAA